MDRKRIRQIIAGIFAVILAILGISQADLTSQNESEAPSSWSASSQVSYGEAYTSPEDVAAYLKAYEELPPNYLTKDEARDRGWVNSEGNLHEVAPGASIGGDPFHNLEGHLPEKSGRQYYEADVNYEGGYRGAERLVYSNDGLIFYTDDHYDSFTQLE